MHNFKDFLIKSYINLPSENYYKQWPFTSKYYSNRTERVLPFEVLPFHVSTLPALPGASVAVFLFRRHDGLSSVVSRFSVLLFPESTTHVLSMVCLKSFFT
jgi:hypothetical protein